jgi:predicted nuclease with TOPRIM domain
MTENQEKQVMNLLTRTIKGIEDLREGQTKLENRLENVENDLAIVKTEVKVINKKMSNYSDDVAELRARVEILEEKVLSIN